MIMPWTEAELKPQADRTNMQFLEVIVDGHNKQVMSIDDSQFGFVPRVGTTDAFIVVQDLQEKYLAMTKRLYAAFVELEKAFDCVP